MDLQSSSASPADLDHPGGDQPRIPPTLQTMASETMLNIFRYLSNSKRDAWALAMTSRAHYLLARQHVLFRCLYIGWWDHTVDFVSRMRGFRRRPLVRGRSRLEEDVDTVLELGVADRIREIHIGFNTDCIGPKAQDFWGICAIPVTHLCKILPKMVQLRAAHLYGDGMGVMINIMVKLGVYCDFERFTALHLHWRWRSGDAPLFTVAIPPRSLEHLSLHLRDDHIWDRVFTTSLGSILTAVVHRQTNLTTLEIHVSTSCIDTGEDPWTKAFAGVYEPLRVLRYHSNQKARFGMVMDLARRLLHIGRAFPNLEELQLHGNHMGYFRLDPAINRELTRLAQQGKPADSINDITIDLFRPCWELFEHCKVLDLKYVLPDDPVTRIFRDAPDDGERIQDNIDSMQFRLQVLNKAALESLPSLECATWWYEYGNYRAYAEVKNLSDGRFIQMSMHQELEYQGKVYTDYELKELAEGYRDGRRAFMTPLVLLDRLTSM